MLGGCPRFSCIYFAPAKLKVKSARRYYVISAIWVSSAGGLVRSARRVSNLRPEPPRPRALPGAGGPGQPGCPLSAQLHPLVLQEPTLPARSPTSAGDPKRQSTERRGTTGNGAIPHGPRPYQTRRSTVGYTKWGAKCSRTAPTLNDS